MTHKIKNTALKFHHLSFLFWNGGSGMRTPPVWEVD